jgi:hypothetical protein
VAGNVGFLVDKVALRQVSSEYFGFPCPFSLNQMLHTPLSPGAATVGQLVADVPSGLSVTLPHHTKLKQKVSYMSIHAYEDIPFPPLVLSVGSQKMASNIARALVFPSFAADGTKTILFSEFTPIKYIWRF